MLKPLYSASDDEKPTDREETQEEMITRLRRKARKMMYNEKGVAYAPWMSRQIDEDVRPPHLFPLIFTIMSLI